MFQVFIDNKDKDIIGEFIADSYFFDASKYEYAFYLERNGERIQSRWYKKNTKVVFNLKDLSGKFQIKCFLRDVEIRNNRSFKSDILAINV